MQRLVLIGGGHAHLSVLEALAHKQPPHVEVTLITPCTHQNYSGMLPGWIAGHYALSDCQIDLQALVQAAKATLTLDNVVGIDAIGNTVQLANGEHVGYDWLSIDIGSETETAGLERLGNKLLPVKPLDNFFKQWPLTIAQAKAQGTLNLVVAGAGAAGVELVLAARFALQQAGVQAKVTLIGSEHGVLKGHHPRVQERLLAYAKSVGVTVHLQRALGTPEGVLLADGQLVPADWVIAATGARAPAWLQSSALARDASGYILVDAHHRSISHPRVFAAGDICARPQSNLSRSGVHAVRAGPVLARNLLAALRAEALHATYAPRTKSLYLLACGPRYAIASWGQWSAQGAWVWYWKNWIDRRFIKRFAKWKTFCKK
jgi:pyridine nucleotide-disulfide oxidoreductase family protein